MEEEEKNSFDPNPGHRILECSIYFQSNMLENISLKAESLLVFSRSIETFSAPLSFHMTLCIYLRAVLGLCNQPRFHLV